MAVNAFGGLLIVLRLCTSFHTGKTPLGHDFGQAYDGWHKSVEKPFLAHLHKCYREYLHCVVCGIT